MAEDNDGGLSGLLNALKEFQESQKELAKVLKEAEGFVFGRR